MFGGPAHSTGLPRRTERVWSRENEGGSSKDERGPEHSGVPDRDQLATDGRRRDREGGVVCAESGSEREALRIAMDLDELLNEASTLHGAVCLVGRMNRKEERASPP